ncbi:hypothetical protein CGGC5_v010922 [Colletotrichum fructicola Nara gc5]|uniref:Uncharacterized protein n=1 Tax=Colletotrichum fructicola (strain Nara gc5) TaxID=1213859 RepID=A0A7J6IWF6_COLFN|nr:hypothetical protein CGGC5_v010922 [Colletotrichum fructicola Nara gc5]KAF5488442.1 hypothetical protein CGCF413_v012494 [Colletotrichum fructicola]
MRGNKTGSVPGTKSTTDGRRRHGSAHGGQSHWKGKATNATASERSQKEGVDSASTNVLGSDRTSTSAVNPLPCVSPILEESSFETQGADPKPDKSGTFPAHGP